MADEERMGEWDLDDWFAEPEAPSTSGPQTPEERKAEGPAGAGELEDWLQERPHRARSRPRRAGTLATRRLTLAAVLFCICLLAGLAAAGVFGGGAHQHPPSAVTAAAASASQLTASSPPAPFTPPRPKAPIRPLKGGARGRAVVALQRALARLGYYAGRIDGQYGAGTESALSRFQTQSGLTPDGILGPKTRRALKSALKG